MNNTSKRQQFTIYSKTKYQKIQDAMKKLFNGEYVTFHSAQKTLNEAAQYFQSIQKGTGNYKMAMLAAPYIQGLNQDSPAAISKSKFFQHHLQNMDGNPMRIIDQVRSYANQPIQTQTIIHARAAMAYFQQLKRKNGVMPQQAKLFKTYLEKIEGAQQQQIKRLSQIINDYFKFSGVQKQLVYDKIMQQLKGSQPFAKIQLNKSKLDKKQENIVKNNLHAIYNRNQMSQAQRQKYSDRTKIQKQFDQRYRQFQNKKNTKYKDIQDPLLTSYKQLNSKLKDFFSIDTSKSTNMTQLFFGQNSRRAQLLKSQNKDVNKTVSQIGDVASFLKKVKKQYKSKQKMTFFQKIDFLSDSLNFMIDIYDFGTNMIKGAFFVAKNITDPKTVWDATILCLKQIVQVIWKWGQEYIIKFISSVTKSVKQRLQSDSNNTYFDMILRYQGVLGVLGLFLGNLAKLIILGDTVGIMGFLATTLLNIIQQMTGCNMVVQIVENVTGDPQKKTAIYQFFHQFNPCNILTSISGAIVQSKIGFMAGNILVPILIAVYMKNDIVLNVLSHLKVFVTQSTATSVKYVKDIVQNVYTSVNQKINGYTSQFKRVTSSINTEFRNYFANLKTDLMSYTQSFTQSIKNSQIYQSFQSYLNVTINTIQDKTKKILVGLKQAFEYMSTPIALFDRSYIGIQWYIGKITDAINNVYDKISYHFGWISKQIKQYILPQIIQSKMQYIKPDEVEHHSSQIVKNKYIQPQKQQQMLYVQKQLQNVFGNLFDQPQIHKILQASAQEEEGLQSIPRKRQIVYNQNMLTNPYSLQIDIYRNNTNQLKLDQNNLKQKIIKQIELMQYQLSTDQDYRQQISNIVVAYNKQKSKYNVKQMFADLSLQQIIRLQVIKKVNLNSSQYEIQSDLKNIKKQLTGSLFGKMKSKLTQFVGLKSNNLYDKVRIQAQQSHMLLQSLNYIGNMNPKQYQINKQQILLQKNPQFKRQLSQQSQSLTYYVKKLLRLGISQQHAHNIASGSKLQQSGMDPITQSQFIALTQNIQSQWQSIQNKNKKQIQMLYKQGKTFQLGGAQVKSIQQYKNVRQLAIVQLFDRQQQQQIKNTLAQIITQKQSVIKQNYVISRTQNIDAQILDQIKQDISDKNLQMNDSKIKFSKYQNLRQYSMEIKPSQVKLTGKHEKQLKQMKQQLQKLNRYLYEKQVMYQQLNKKNQQLQQSNRQLKQKVNMFQTISKQVNNQSAYSLKLQLKAKNKQIISLKKKKQQSVQLDEKIKQIKQMQQQYDVYKLNSVAQIKRLKNKYQQDKLQFTQRSDKQISNLTKKIEQISKQLVEQEDIKQKTLTKQQTLQRQINFTSKIPVGFSGRRIKPKQQFKGDFQQKQMQLFRFAEKKCRQMMPKKHKQIDTIFSDIQKHSQNNTVRCQLALTIYIRTVGHVYNKVITQQIPEYLDMDKFNANPDVITWTSIDQEVKKKKISKKYKDKIIQDNNGQNFTIPTVVSLTRGFINKSKYFA